MLIALSAMRVFILLRTLANRHCELIQLSLNQRYTVFWKHSSPWIRDTFLGLSVQVTIQQMESRMNNEVYHSYGQPDHMNGQGDASFFDIYMS
jgi:hypothetical protein